jgi:hypothetical protein
MTKTNLTPTTLRLILIGSMVAGVALAVGVFMLGYQRLSAYSVSTRAVAVQAQASNSSLQNLITLKKELAADQDVVERASMIVSESKSYLYQDQIIQDINRFATSSGITITNIAFGDTGTAGTVAPAPPAPAAGGTATGPATAPAGAAPAGIKTTTATVTVKNPVDYTKMLTFIHSVEESLFKMRISQVTLSKPTDAKAPNDVTSDVLTIEVYLR